MWYCGMRCTCRELRRSTSHIAQGPNFGHSFTLTLNGVSIKIAYSILAAAIILASHNYFERIATSVSQCFVIASVL